VAASLASLWVLGLCASVLHAATDQHRYCAQHHAFEDIGPASASASAPASVGAPAGRASDDGRDHIERHPGERADQHDSCPFASPGVQAAAGRVYARVAAAPVLPAVARAPIVVAHDAPIPLLHLAPKSSPPATAV